MADVRTSAPSATDLVGWASDQVAEARLSLERLGRRVRNRLGGPRATFVYDLAYEYPPNAIVDSRRGRKVLDYLVQEGCVSAREVVQPGRLRLEGLARVHSYAYLERVSDPDVLVRIFGEEVRSVEAETIIGGQRQMVAGTVECARRAVRQPGQIQVNLGGGLHHARADQGAGFCLFNDVAVAIRALRAEGFTGRVLVVDLDLHQGDGTRRIFADDPTVFTFSIHASDWDTEPAVADRNVALGSGIGDASYLDAVRQHLPEVVRAAAPDLVFYVAGVDVANDDRFGAWRVSDDAILERDRLVLRSLAGRPFVWLLAGGYGPDAWRHTARPLADLLAGLDAPIPSQYELDLEAFRRIKRSLTRAELSGEAEDDVILRPEDLLLDLVGPARRSRLMGFYTLYGFELALERYGVLGAIRAAGYPHLHLDLSLDHPTGERLRIHAADEPRALLMELVLKESRECPPYRMLSIEWLLLQSPRARPTANRPLLPGQRHPGLGILRPLVLVLVMMCERLRFDGLAFCPAHFHVAAQAHAILQFLHAEDAGRFAAINAALPGVPLSQATQLVHDHALIDEATDEPVSWKPAPMIIPVSARAKAHFEDPAYAAAVEAAANALHLRRR
jgi:acetoin utilization deacetylase AcuC-like enzyme